MAAKIEFTAQIPGTEDAPVTRTSGTMPYVATVDGVTWHKSFASAYKAAQGRQFGPGATVYPVLPTAIKGKLGDWTPEIDGWGEIPASAFTELVAAKNASKTVALPIEIAAETPGADPVETEAEAPAPVEELMTVDAAVDAEIARRAEAAEEIEAAEPVVAKASAPSPLKLKQLLGDQIHKVILEAWADGSITAPEGMSTADAQDNLDRWLSYISHTR
ncbi:hypothetical protein PBI_RICH_95 [Mycobacterium phage Rich]|uniref:Uncharacterized protein n=1 Tax=Mycobacterium phage Rich TaxID=1927021 RepID=A0A1L6BZ42_9CAUD|nr:hypothetical protein PBI_RICH_95 [Mycobacterium phage Rich]